MPISLIDEQENHFTLHDGNESFPVAKFGLDDTTMGQIRSLPQGYADGGKVYDPTGMFPQDDSDFNATQSPSMQLFNQSFQPKEEAQILPSQGINFLTPDQQSTLGANFPRADAATSTGLGLMGPTTTYEAPAMEMPGATPAQTGLPGYLSQTESFMKGTQQQQAPGMQLGGPSEYTKAFDQMQQGTLMQAQASAEAAKQQAQVYDQQMQELQKNEVARKAQADAVMTDINKIQNDVMTQKIDPTRVWSNMSTGNRVLAGISIFLGGVAGGMQGTENRALGIIQDAVNKDIDAQKADIGKKQNMLSLNMAKYNNINDAAAATKAQLLSITQAQINQSAAKMGSRQALAAAQVANAQIDLQKAQLINQISTSQATAQKMAAPEGLSLQDAQTLPENIRERIVPLPSGKFTVVINKDDVRPIKEAYQTYAQSKPLLNRVKEFMAKGATAPVGERANLEDSLKGQLLLLTKNVEKLGQITESDMKLINSLIPQPGSYFQSGQQQKLDQLNIKLDEMLNAAYAGRTGYNKAGMSLKEQPVFGSK
jgi:hypothetical protein